VEVTISSLSLSLSVQEFCAHKATDAAAAGAQDDSETWTFMGVLFEEDARRQLLAKLGFADALSAAAAGSGSVDAAGGLAGSSSVDVAGQQLHSAMEQLGLGDGELLRLIECRCIRDACILAGSSSVAGQQLHSAMEQLGLGDGELLRSTIGSCIQGARTPAGCVSAHAAHLAASPVVCRSRRFMLHLVLHS
jgi:hypothetical protein